MPLSCTQAARVVWRIGAADVADSVPELISLQAILDHPEDLTWSDWVYLPANEEWTLESKGLVLDADDLEPDEDIPAPAKDVGLKEALLVQDVQAIVSNLQQQLSARGIEPSLTDKLQAFKYYYDNDAFITL